MQHDDKLNTLKEDGSLNPHPERVLDTLFQQEEFFDPNDLVQVKYEMLRRVRKDGASVTQTVNQFGFCRLSYYRTQTAFEQRGISALIPGQRGPKRAHKLSHEVMDFVRSLLLKERSTKISAICAEIRVKFGISIHPRSLERALTRGKKKNSQRASA